jgi:hypothetical protein
MVDNLTERGPGDRNRINVSEDWERRYWSRALGISEEQLQKAVGAVGSSVQAVRDYVRGKGPSDTAAGKGSSSPSGRSNKD